jgi:uncharacterized paraquat-inducible protein A
MWGNLSTKMFQTYVRLGEKDIEREFLEKGGIQQKPAELTDTLKPRPCPTCHLINAPTSSYCSKCGSPLTDSARYEGEYTGDTVRQLLIENPVAQTALLELLKDLKK